MAICYDYEALGIVESRRYWRYHLTEACPMPLLLKATGTCVAGWMLTDTRGERLPDGRWKSATCWERREPWVEVLNSAGQPMRFQIYQKTKLLTVLRLLWLLLCCQWFEGAGELSYPIDKEALNGRRAT